MLTNNEQAATMLLGPEATEKLLAKTVLSAEGDETVTIGDYQSVVECDHRRYMARLVAVTASRDIPVAAGESQRSAVNSPVGQTGGVTSLLLGTSFCRKRARPSAIGLRFRFRPPARRAITVPLALLPLAFVANPARPAEHAVAIALLLLQLAFVPVAVWPGMANAAVDA